MKYDIILISLFLLIINSSSIIIYPIDKYKSYKIKYVNNSILYFSLNLEEFKLNDKIYLEYSSSERPSLNDIQYFCSKDNFKNITNYSNIPAPIEKSGFSENSINGDVTYILYTKTKKISTECNSLFINISSKSYYGKKFEVDNAKTPFGTTIFIIFMIILLIMVITFGIYVYIKNKNNYSNTNYGVNPSIDYNINVPQNTLNPNNQYAPPHV